MAQPSSDHIIQTVMESSEREKSREKKTPGADYASTKDIDDDDDGVIIGEQQIKQRFSSWCPCLMPTVEVDGGLRFLEVVYTATGPSPTGQTEGLYIRNEARRAWSRLRGLSSSEVVVSYRHRRAAHFAAPRFNQDISPPVCRSSPRGNTVTVLSRSRAPAPPSFGGSP